MNNNIQKNFWAKREDMLTKEQSSFSKIRSGVWAVILWTLSISWSANGADLPDWMQLNTVATGFTLPTSAMQL